MAWQSRHKREAGHWSHWLTKGEAERLRLLRIELAHLRVQAATVRQEIAEMRVRATSRRRREGARKQGETGNG